MKYKFVSICLLMVATFASCKKDELLVVENPAAPLTLLSEVVIDDQLSFEYAYNSANFINEIKSKLDYTLHHYDNLNKLVSTDYYVNYNIFSNDPQTSTAAINQKDWVTPDNNNKGYTINYEYDSNGLLSKATYLRPLASSSEYSDFTYDVNNRISRQNLYWENTKTGYIDYSYDVSGNLVSEILYYVPLTGAAVTGTTTLYEFDNKLNPYKNFSKMMMPGINTNLNNIIKETYTVNPTGAEGTSNVQMTATTYEYNSNGYPVTKNGTTKYIYK